VAVHRDGRFRRPPLLAAIVVWRVGSIRW